LTKFKTTYDFTWTYDDGSKPLGTSTQTDYIVKPIDDSICDNCPNGQKCFGVFKSNRTTRVNKYCFSKNPTGTFQVEF